MNKQLLFCFGLLVVFMGCVQSPLPTGILLIEDVNKLIVNQSFLDLNDTPNSFSGQASLCVSVNSDENSLIFSVCGAGSSDTTLDVNVNALFSFLSKSYDWNADQNFLKITAEDINIISGFILNNDLNYSLLDLNRVHTLQEAFDVESGFRIIDMSGEQGIRFDTSNPQGAGTVTVFEIDDETAHANSRGWRPLADATYDFGTSFLRWRDGYFSGTIRGQSGAQTLDMNAETGSINISGDLNVGNQINTVDINVSSGRIFHNLLDYNLLDLNWSVRSQCGSDVNSFLNSSGECIKITDFNGTGAVAVDANGSFLQSFTNGDLTNGVIRVSHDLNNSYPSVTVFDSNELIVLPNRVLFVDLNTIDINLLGFIPLVGTWNAKIITRAGTGVTAAAVNGFTADFNNNDLSNGILIVTHDLDKAFPQAIIYNDLNRNILPDSVENITVNRVDVNLLNFVPITGTWRVRITANN